jgi:SpoVK/Ycf46/Vps4 family AAA+-type ATPase
MAKGLVRYAGGNLLRDDIELELTPEGIDKFMPELTPELKSKLGRRGPKLPSYAMSPEKIQPVKLLFENNIKTQIQDLEKLMRPSVFQKYKKSLSPSDRMRGLTILLHGDPGTGKTELALQLAKAGNRPIFKLDVTQIKSKWVGESEKNLKNFFSDYNRHLKTENAEPVLLLNECDGLLSKRMAVNTSVDQMTNSLQNILLENLENFQGILIATTNLTINLDSAFERRFLYKIHFPAPGSEIMSKLWKQSIPGLSITEARQVAENFKFTPGEMLNVARKAALRKMLKPGISLLDTVLQLCSEEKWDSHKKSKLGFQN